MSATDYAAALDAVLRATNPDFAGADPRNAALLRRELANALRSAGFVHLDARCAEALRRGMRTTSLPEVATDRPRENASASVSYPTSGSVRADAQPAAGAVSQVVKAGSTMSDEERAEEIARILATDPDEDGDEDVDENGGEEGEDDEAAGEGDF